ncbi:hypothetical protein DLAC_05015 [Tieghemostelium lacteum]|uniref:Uncharacterized protein n=1 Tax=Tieghemostelium lacteum TaxID=361077 RepID=A0A151ZI38_TIELA|nr:hypothetical protein DLAC_05015 [Tieghemostelium lacteum]|eukprot:KYQ93633.1 hypothetical protein DLAC_05015 [Tieghemostelium lacteum]
MQSFNVLLLFIVILSFTNLVYSQTPTAFAKSITIKSNIKTANETNQCKFELKFQIEYTLQAPNKNQLSIKSLSNTSVVVVYVSSASLNSNTFTYTYNIITPVGNFSDFVLYNRDQVLAPIPIPSNATNPPSNGTDTTTPPPTTPGPNIEFPFVTCKPVPTLPPTPTPTPNETTPPPTETPTETPQLIDEDSTLSSGSKITSVSLGLLGVLYMFM